MLSNPQEIVNYIIMNHRNQVARPELFEYLNKVIESGQVIVSYNNNKVNGVLSYAKISEADLPFVIQHNDRFQLPENYTSGDIVWIDIVEKDKELTIFSLFEALMSKEPTIKVFCWLSRRNKVVTTRRRFEHA